MRKIIFRAAFFLSLIASVGIFLSYQFIFCPITETKTTILVPRETTFEALKEILRSHKLVHFDWAFDVFCNRKNFYKVHPGRYLIDSCMNLNSMVNMLRAGIQSPLSIIFNNSSNLFNLASQLSAQVEADSSEFVSAFIDSNFLEEENLDIASVRKFFIPNTYEVYWTITPKEFLERMQKEYNYFWSKKRLLQAKKIGLSANEVSVLASIVQRETSKVDEQSIVAGLYLNRLNQGMKLQSDPTVIYAIKERYGFQFEVKRVLKKDLKIKSAYNTYLNTGLPPNPICIPEMAALLSVLNAKKHPYIYMCAKEDFSGYHNFTDSWATHKRNAKKFQNALSNKGVLR